MARILKNSQIIHNPAILYLADLAHTVLNGGRAYAIHFDEKRDYYLDFSVLDRCEDILNVIIFFGCVFLVVFIEKNSIPIFWNFFVFHT